MWLREYGTWPEDVDSKPANEIWMILYARKAKLVNAEWERVKKQMTGQGKTISADQLASQFGDLK